MKPPRLLPRSLILLLALLAPAGWLHAQDAEPSSEPMADAARIRRVRFDGGINMVNQLRITKAIEEANAAGDDLVLVQLDTPGGAVIALDEIVEAILNSQVPVVVWVGPPGARAASAGFFVLLAADVAAMAPGTRTGAASTVYGNGQASQEGDVLLKKANEDGAALLRSIAKRRGRDVAAAEAAVFEAKSYDEQTALELGLADRIVGDVDTLLAELDGQVIRRFDGSEFTLRTAGATFVETEFDGLHRFQEMLANPAIVSFLLLAAMAGLYFEFQNPGGIFPGVLGAICLVMFVWAAQILPISGIGVLLILTGIVLFVLEVKVSSFGLLTLAGSAAMGFGLWLLIDTPIPELRLSPWAIVPMTAALAAFVLLSLNFALRAQKVKVETGEEGLVGRVGRVVVELSPRGKVFVHGERWNAETEGESLPVDARVRVVAVDSLRLKVVPETENERSA